MRVKKWRRVKKRKSHGSSSPPMVVLPVGILIVSLGLLCLIIYGLSACRFNLDRLN